VWALNISRSTLRIEIPKKILVKIEHREPNITQNVLVTSADDQVQQMAFTFNTTGAETTNRVGGAIGRTKAHWRGSVLVIESLLKVADRELHFRDHWTLSDDKKILTMAHPDDDLAGQISILESVSSQDVGKFRSSGAND
jgi:hypothetical protein